MKQSNPSRLEDHKMRTTFVVIGGVVASVTALAVVFGLQGVKTVRLGDESRSDDGASFAALLPANASGSNDSNQVPLIQVASMSSPSTAPSIANSTLLPTSKPTQQLRKYSPANLVHTASATRELNLFLEEKFRLKLYWEVGYYWQEETVEKWWCMACVGTCTAGGSIKIRDCTKKSSADATFVVSSSKGSKGYQYRVSKSDLCLQTTNPIVTLSPCNKDDPRQFFVNKPNAKFDIRPITSKDRCLTQHHHPKADEIIYAENCSIAHKTTTGYWAKY